MFDFNKVSLRKIRSLRWRSLVILQRVKLSNKVLAETKAEKIYQQDKVSQIFDENFRKCLSDLDDQSSEMVGRRSLALMMTQI